MAMIISNDIESFMKTNGKEECSNINIVRKEAGVSWHHSYIKNYEAAQREMIQLSNLLKRRW
ncbi:MAG: hypothetical protein ACLTNL_07340 [Clostridium sp.]